MVLGDVKNFHFSKKYNFISNCLFSLKVVKKSGESGIPYSDKELYQLPTLIF